MTPGGELQEREVPFSVGGRAYLQEEGAFQRRGRAFLLGFFFGSFRERVWFREPGEQARRRAFRCWSERYFFGWIFGELRRELPGEKFSRSLRRVQIENQGELAGEQRRRYPFFSRGSRVEKNPV